MAPAIGDRSSSIRNRQVSIDSNVLYAALWPGMALYSEDERPLVSFVHKKPRTFSTTGLSFQPQRSTGLIHSYG